MVLLGRSNKVEETKETNHKTATGNNLIPDWKDECSGSKLQRMELSTSGKLLQKNGICSILRQYGLGSCAMILTAGVTYSAWSHFHLPTLSLFSWHKLQRYCVYKL